MYEKVATFRLLTSKGFRYFRAPMKRTLFILAATLFAAIASPIAIAAPAPEKPAASKAEPKAMPFNLTVDALSKTGFVHNNKDGTKVTHNLTDKTVIKQGKSEAKFEDIKVGDTVSGLRTKTKEDGSEYAIVKITKFAPEAPVAPKKK